MRMGSVRFNLPSADARQGEGKSNASMQAGGGQKLACYKILLVDDDDMIRMVLPEVIKMAIS